ncbi:MAG: FAD-dependent oxidoreductase [Kiritimatiellae bacterium]|nr:FAD-dependent oxidoreductase [Kiritimatiellia bacterium]
MAMLLNPAQGVTRRSFFRSMALAGAAVPASAMAETEKIAGAGVLREPARDIPVRDDADVIVCGAGPAGVSAAIAAARAGANTRLFDINGCLGGIWTAGLLCWVLDYKTTGLADEITQRLDARDARRAQRRRSRYAYEPEEMKLLLENMCTEAGVKVRLHTGVRAAYREDRRLTAIVTESKSGREAWRAKNFIDATGDGDLAAFAGCGFDLGQPGTGKCQPLTMYALVLVKDAEALKAYLTEEKDTADESQRYRSKTSKLMRELHRAGTPPSYNNPSIFYIRDNVVLFMFNHEYGVNVDDADAITAATMNARRELNAMADGLRKLGGVWDNLRIIATSEHIGIREGRRIHGLYQVTMDDLAKGARHEDAIVRARFGVDVHCLSLDNKEDSHGEITKGLKVKPYDVPLRALISRDLDNMLMAGRCISGDFFAHASYRVTGNSVPMGEAAGRTAALAALSGRLPAQVGISELKLEPET